MANSCAWKSWRTVWEWEPGVPPDPNLTAFLDRVDAAIARLEITLGECGTGDMVALLTPELLRLAGVTDPPISLVRAIVRGRWTDDTREPRAEEWLTAVAALAAAEAPPVQTVVVCVVLERVLHAAGAAGDSPEPVESLEEIADALASLTKQVLRAVLYRVVSPAEYRTM